jgi:hypothetical protein
VQLGDWEDPRSAVRAILGGALILATLLLVVMALGSHHVDWQWVAFVSLLWVFWVVFNDTVNLVIMPLVRIFSGAAAGNGVPITMDEETAYLERLVDNPAADAHRRVLTALRLAEIYRTHQHDPSKADTLLARMRAQYPAARELHVVTPGA